MDGFIEWLLTKLRLVDDEADEIEIEEEPSEEIIPWLELVGRRKIKDDLYNRHIFCKKIMSYEDTKEVISKYKLGAECVVYINPMENPDAQGMMNYICGGIFALEGTVGEVGGNVFTVLHKAESE